MADLVEMQLTTQLAGSTSPPLVEQWFGGALRAIREVEGSQPEGAGAASTTRRSGAVGGKVSMLTSRSGAGRSFPWTGTGLRQFLADIVAGAEGTLIIEPAIIDLNPTVVSLAVARHESVPDWVYFTFTFSEQILDHEPSTATFLRFFRSFAESANPSFGHVAPNLSIHRTPLEMLLLRVPDKYLLDSRQTLRGYSWLTICPQEIGDRLGGEEGLRATGAFLEVAHLGAGGYWLRVGARYRDFDFSSAEKVFLALACVLPAGMPVDSSQWRDRRKYLVVRADAATIVGSASPML